tara:strand:- start:223 stop:726 length:504 start_codon:yes stop_codon:yes gene_type:complete
MRKKTFDQIVKALVFEANKTNSKVEFKQFKPEELRIETDDTYELKYDDIKATIEYNSTDTDKVRANRKSIDYPVKDRMVSIFVTDHTDGDFVIKRDFFVTEYKNDNGSYKLHFSTYVRVETPKGTKRVLSRANQVIYIYEDNKDWTETRTMFNRTSKSIFNIVNGKS